MIHIYVRIISDADNIYNWFLIIANNIILNYPKKYGTKYNKL